MSLRRDLGSVTALAAKRELLADLDSHMRQTGRQENVPLVVFPQLAHYRRYYRRLARLDSSAAYQIRCFTLSCMRTSFTSVSIEQPSLSMSHVLLPLQGRLQRPPGPGPFSRNLPTSTSEQVMVRLGSVPYWHKPAVVVASVYTGCTVSDYLAVILVA